MPSRTSFFNRTLYRRNLTRFWPLWVMASFLAALFPLALLMQLLQGYDHVTAVEFTQGYYHIVSYGVPWLTLIYAIFCAMMVWSYLYNARSVGTMHTLPIRREGLFVTNFLSGMTMVLAPYATAGILCILISLAFGFFDPAGLLVTILAVAGECFFYFSSATFVAFVTGNVFALPALYFILHFLAAGLDLLVSLFAQGFIFGLNSEYTGVVEFLSPTVYLMSRVGVDSTYEEVPVPGEAWTESVLVATELENVWLIGVYALVGAALLALAWLMYKRRRSETAGDVVSVGWMKPVFRYGVTICGALLGGLLLYALFWMSFQDGDYYETIPLAVFMLIAGAIGYYAASMLLAKSLKVFRGSGKGLAVMAVSVAAIVVVFHFDLLGVETRVPEVREVEKVTLSAADNSYTFYPGQDDALIEQLRAAHSAIVADKLWVEYRNYRDTYVSEDDEETISRYNYVFIRYYLTNGLKVERRYNVPITRDRLAQAGTYDQLLDSLVNSETMKQKRLHVGDETMKPFSGDVYAEVSSESLSFGTREAEAVLAAVSADAAAGAWGNYDWLNDDYGDQYAIHLSLQFQDEEEPDGNRSYDHISISVYPEMTNTVDCLLELGLVRESDLQTRRQLYPEEYRDEYNEKYGVTYTAPSTTDVYVIEDAGEQASIGIIGGADGPTEIFVA